MAETKEQLILNVIVLIMHVNITEVLSYILRWLLIY